MTAGHAHHHHGADPAQVVMDGAYWDERYRSTGALWSGRPNPQLVAEAADLTPGAALDVGCGEGADAIWLAARGWQVTAVDISTVALQRGAGHARQAGGEVAGRITWQHADLTAWVPEVSAWDLVSAQFMHLPTDAREALHRRLAASVAPGGFLLVVGHHPDDMHAVPRPVTPDWYYTAADVAAALDPLEWDVVVSESRARTMQDPEGRSTTIHDAVLRARRRP